MAENPAIRPVCPGDAPAIAEIYNYYITGTAITFEEEALPVQEMENRIRDISAQYPWLVREEAGQVAGYAYISKYKDRVSYRHTAELSIYLRNGLEGKGMGTALLSRLLGAIDRGKIHVLVSGITLHNERSVALHEKFGFAKAAHFHEVGFKFNKWLDVGYWELALK